MKQKLIPIDKLEIMRPAIIVEALNSDFIGRVVCRIALDMAQTMDFEPDDSVNPYHGWFFPLYTHYGIYCEYDEEEQREEQREEPASHITNHEVFMKMALEFSKLSKCVSYKVACLLVDQDGDIISSGLNGSPSGYQNCCDKFPNYNKSTQREDHHEWSNTHELHAEQNAIIRASRKSKSIKGCVAYCTLKPCLHCSKMLVTAGIEEIYYHEEYDKNEDEILNSFLKDCGVKLTQIKFDELSITSDEPSQDNGFLVV